MFIPGLGSEMYKWRKLAEAGTTDAWFSLLLTAYDVTNSLSVYLSFLSVIGYTQEL